MAFTDFERAVNLKALKSFIEQRRPPEHIRPQLDIGFSVVGQTVDIFEIRPDWQDKTTIDSLSSCAGEVRQNEGAVGALLDAQRDLKWHAYEPDHVHSTLASALKTARPRCLLLLSSRARCCLTCRSTGAPTAGHLGRAAPWFIIRRAALASCRRRPVSSTLGRRTSPLKPCLPCPSSSAQPWHQAPVHLRWHRGRICLQGPRSRAETQGRSVGGYSGRRLVRLACRGARHQNTRTPAARRWCQLAPKSGTGRIVVMSTRSLKAQRLPLCRAATAPASTRCGLTNRSTGAPTAGQLGRAAALVHHRPHGQAVLPPSPG